MNTIICWFGWHCLALWLWEFNKSHEYDFPEIFVGV